MTTKDENNGRGLSEADAKSLLDAENRYANTMRSALDIPLTNRAFLLGVAYLAEVICYENAGSVKDAAKIASELQHALASDIEHL